MNGLIAILAVGLCDLVGLILIPLGLPGLWVMLLALLGYGFVSDFRTVGLWTLTITVALAFLGEIIESWLGFR